MRPVREVVQRVLVAVHVALDDGLHPLVLVLSSEEQVSGQRNMPQECWATASLIASHCVAQGEAKIGRAHV